MAYDQPLKELLRPFFAEFLTSFFPSAAARLNLDTITFLEKEATTDLLRGRRREMDLVARVARRDGSTTLVIVLVELQARPEQEFPWRLFEYYTLLRRVYRLPVLPIVVYVRGGRGSELWEEYREELFLPLPVEEEQRFRQLANQEEHEMAKLADYETWRKEQWLQAKREDVLTVLRTRFGPAPEEWERRVEAMASLPELDALLVRLLKASRLEEVE